MTAVRRVLIVVSIPLVLLVVVGTLRARATQAAESRVDQTLRDLKVFSETLELVERFYVEEVELGQLERGAFQGLAESLDPWSSYWDPERMDALLERDRRGSVGVLLMKPAQEYVRIVSVLPGGPADEAELRPGQYVETIDGLETKDLTLLEARAMLEGPPGSEVELGFFRERDQDAHPKMKLTRRSLDDLRLVVERLEGGAALVRLGELRGDVVERLRSALGELEAADVTDLVLDLRTTLDGDVETARAVADLFVEPGALFTRRDRDGDTVHAAVQDPAWSGELAVLVGPGTVGSAEVLAHALHEREAAVLVGTRTFGKRTIQDLVVLSDGAGLYLTIAELRGADGEELPEAGIEPDEVVEPRRRSTEATDEKSTDDESGGEADGAAPGGDAAEGATPDGGDEADERDPQLDRALELLARDEPVEAAETARVSGEPA